MKNIKKQKFNFSYQRGKFIIATFFIAQFIFSSCVSSKKDFQFVDFSSINNIQNQDIQIDKVEVFLDETLNQHISTELEEIIKLKLLNLNSKKSKKIPNENFLQSENLFLTVKIYEQSFIENFENHNSIFTNAIIKNQNDKIIFQNNFYTNTNKTILSSVIQEKEIGKIFNEISKIKKGK